MRGEYERRSVEGEPSASIRLYNWRKAIAGLGRPSIHYTGNKQFFWGYVRRDA